MEFLRTYLGVDLGTDGDYLPGRTSQGIRLIRRETCSHGHPVVQTSRGSCPRCRRNTTLFFCKDRSCDGTQTSHAHETVCPINRGRSID